jgi:hypothetical protein
MSLENQSVPPPSIKTTCPLKNLEIVKEVADRMGIKMNVLAQAGMLYTDPSAGYHINPNNRDMKYGTDLSTIRVPKGMVYVSYACEPETNKEFHKQLRISFKERDKDKYKPRHAQPDCLSG